MNTIQITCALQQDYFTKKTFCGVFPNDKLPTTIKKYPYGLVVNTDPSGMPGTHWISFYFPLEHTGQYFDSFGNPPEFYHRSFKAFLDKHATESASSQALRLATS